MQATIERKTTQIIPRRQVVVDSVTAGPTILYRAPLATFLVLVASGRATACAAEQVERDALVESRA